VRQEIAHAAWLLFADRGYEDTTVGEIARAAGISRRSFFRYFSSKEDVVIGTTDALAEDVLAAFASRPASEPPLVAIQRALTPAIAKRLADTAEARAIVSLLRESRTLRRAMLERHARLEERLAGLIAARTGADLRRDPTPALLAFLARALAEPFDGPTVVVTHHGPHPGSIHPRFNGNVANPAFVSDLSSLMGRAALWIHGHTHASFDYEVAGTRVLANPRGYAGPHPVSGRVHGTPDSPENPAFDPALTVELSS